MIIFDNIKTYLLPTQPFRPYMKVLISLLFLVLGVCGLRAQTVRSVSGFPSAEPGYSLGVSACYAGRIGDYLVMAGGCNFPEQGKPKKYYAGVYAARMDSEALQWRLVGFLPEPAAYGVTVASGDSLIIIGGNNNAHALATVYSLHLDNAATRVTVNRLADMPCTVDNMAVAHTGTDVFVVGGNQNGKPSADVLHFSLDAPQPIADASNGSVPTVQYTRLTIPSGPRVQPVATAYRNKVYVWGGFYANGAQSEVYTDGYSFDIDTEEWAQMAAPHSVEGEEMTLSGGIAWTSGARVYATGGVNRAIFLDAISGRYERVKKDDYLNQPIDWYRFSSNLYEFDCEKGEWLPTSFANKALARAGAVVVPTPLGVYYIGGELKPAVRTPKIVIVES